MTASTVLVLGARGRFGSAAVRAFSQAGWKVVAQVRPCAVGLRDLPGVRWLRAAPDDTAALAEGVCGASVVVQALSPVYTHAAWRREVPVLTQAAIAISRRLGATLMLPASVYNFGSTMPAQLLEDTPQGADTFKGRVRIASEQAIEAATRDGAMRAVVIRGGDFFGSGTGSWLDQVIARDLAKGSITWPGPLDVRTTWAFLPDMARSFVRVAERREQLQPFETMHFAGHSVTGAQWAQVLGEVARDNGWLPAANALRVKRVSWPLMRVVGLVVPMVAALCEVRYLWRTPYTLVNRRMAEVAGAETHTPFDAAVREAVAQLRLASSPKQREALAA